MSLPSPSTSHARPADLVGGTAFALAAGLLWGIVFVVPLLLADYPPMLLSTGRYTAFGLIAVVAAVVDRRALRTLTRADWREAARLSLVGNLAYYLLLASAIQHAGAPLPTMIIGTLPVVLALVSNRRDAHRDGRLPWRRLGPSLALIAAGIALVNRAELEALRAQATDGHADLARHAVGALFALGAVACWTWYPLRNADWLRAHPDRSPRAWATAQGVVTLPMAAAGLLVVMGLLHAWPGLGGGAGAAGTASGAVSGLGAPVFALPFGPRPGVFVAAMFATGLLASWGGTLCWNEASQRLPTTVAGQLIVFETLSALTFAFALRGHLPPAATGLGIALLVGGVAWALRATPEPMAAEGHAN